MLGDPRDGPRDLAIVVICALLLVLGLTGLGARAVANEAAATDRELAALVEAEAGRQRQRFARDLIAAEGQLRAGKPSGLPYANEIVVPAEEPTVTVQPATPASVEPDVACRALVGELLRARAEARVASRDAVIGKCPTARSSRGRFLVPWLLLERGTGDDLRVWLDAHGDELEATERAALAEELAKSPFVGAVTWLGASSRTTRSQATLSPDGARALRRRTLAAGEIGPLVDGSTFGRFVREPGGQYRGFVVTPATLASAIDAGVLRAPDDLALRLPSDPRANAGVPVTVGGELRLFVTLRSPEIAARRTRESRVLLGLGAGAISALAVGFLALLLRRMRSVRRAAELRTDFVATVSHELRTPAASLQMLAELSAGEGLSPEERVDVGAALVRESRRLSQTVERLLSLRRMLAGKLTITRATVDVNALLDEALLAADLPPSVRRSAEGIRASLDAGALRLAIDNLLANARKHGRPPYVLRAALQGGSLVIDVADHGPVLSPREARRLFEPFERARDKLSEATEGTGIGLALVRGIARAHGGEASYERTDVEEGGDGPPACFRLRIPAGAPS